MRLTVNGKDLVISHGLTLAELALQQGGNLDIIVIEYNQRIVKREEWQSIVLQPNDCLEVVTFVGGG